MSKNILVLGATGMAGHIIADGLKKNGFNVFTTSRLDFDASDPGQFLPFFQNTISKNVEFVVNCVGVLVEESVHNPQRAKIVNSLLPKFLEAFYCDTDTKVIHISTDCVFDGSKGGYLDSDTPTETTIYGKTKALGEIKNKKDLTLRTSIIGPELFSRYSKNTGLLHWFLTQNKNSTIQGYSNCFWSGISTLELLDAILWGIHSNTANGIKQISREKPISKFDLLKEANVVFNRQLLVEPNSEKHIDKSLVPSTDAMQIRTSYEEMLVHIKEFVSENNERYKYL